MPTTEKRLEQIEMFLHDGYNFKTVEEEAKAKAAADKEKKKNSPEAK